ncbi:MAG: glycosyltransferase family 2 protein [Wenzhouxiangella sp.]|nr:glycosyltransferase family 2 protein [Wenzhouxiangella sp.]
MKSSTSSLRIGAVIVAFHPDPGQIEGLLETLASQVDIVVVVDNSDPKLDLVPGQADGRQPILIHPHGNIGVAAAINQGVDRLLQLGASHALLLDQDSVPDAGMTARLVAELARCEQQGEAVAAIGARIRDRDSGRLAPFVHFRLPFNRHLAGDSGSARCDFLITSGTLLNLQHWERIGPMRESWFIDSVDMEWCFRARRQGWAILGCFDAELEHSIGQTRRVLPLSGSPRYRHHGPERLYTMMRNRVFLYRSGAPVAWIAHDLLRATGKLLLFGLMVGPRRANLAAMLRGLRDGVKIRPVP